MDAQNAFVEKANETLEEKALRVCEVVVSCGLGIRGGQIELRITDRIKSALNSIVFDEKWRDEEIEVRKNIGDERSFIFSFAQDVVALMKHSLEHDSDKSLDDAVVHLIPMVKKGWKTDAKPYNYDLNAAGSKRGTYREPEGLVEELVEAFDIGYKPPSTPQPQRPTGAR